MKNKNKKNFLKSLSNNLGLKLLALAVSIILWFIVTNITDPTESKRFYNIPVEILNEEALTDEGKVYEILDNTGVISTLTVTGKSSVVEKLTSEEIKATADLSEITFLNTVGINISTTRSNADLTFRASTDTLKVSVEDMKRTQMVINASVIGSPADGYVVGSVTPSQNVVRISGPESVVEQIDHVDAVANIGNYAYTSDINTSVDLILYDANGVEIDNSSIKLNISTININITILATKEVPLTFTINGTPAEGYMVTGDTESSISTLNIAGKKSVLESISSITITDESLDITDLTDDFSTTLNIKKLLPSGVSFADSNFDGNVTIKVPIEKIITKDYAVPAANFAVAHVPDGYEAEIVELEDNNTITMSVSGVSSQLTKLQAKDILGVVDMDLIAENLGIEEWEDGEYTGTIVTNLSDDYTLVQEYTLTVRLTSQTD